MTPAETMGDLRSALARVTPEDLSALEEVAFTLTLATLEAENPDLLEAMGRMARARLEPIRAGHGSAWDRVEFVALGAPALAARLREETPWVLDPSRAAATWLAALCWQMTAHFPVTGREECVHVYMGLGGGRDLRLLWDVEMRGWFRYVLIGTGTDDTPGDFTHNATNGRPGLPEGFAFGPGHVDADAARASRIEVESKTEKEH